MGIKLKSRVSSSSSVEPFDVMQVKKALNRLGYYVPYEATGITGMPDAKLFEAIKSFQNNQGLAATGTIAPDDKTLQALNSSANQSQSGQYIWRTVGDDKVRENHAVLEGTTRDWKDSPDPGDDYNCRCWAEPFGLSQVVISSTKQADYKWENSDFFKHWLIGDGKEVTLPQIGWLVEIIEHAKKIMFKKVEKQLADKAREVESGEFEDDWNNSYNFEEVVYSIGDAVIRGRFQGTVSKRDKFLDITAKAYYFLDDMFEDVLDIREALYKGSSRDAMADNIAGDVVFYVTEAGQTPYPITGTWVTEISGTISSTD